MDSIAYIESSIVEGHEKILNLRLATDLLQKSYPGVSSGAYNDIEIAIQHIQSHIEKLQEILERLHSERQL